MYDPITPTMLPAVSRLLEILAVIFSGLCIASFAVAASGIIWLCFSESKNQKARRCKSTITGTFRAPDYSAARREVSSFSIAARFALATAAFVFTLLLSLTAAGQEPQIVGASGTTAELYGLRRVFIETNAQAARRRIVRELRRRLPALEIVDDARRADARLVYRSETLRIEEKFSAPRRADNGDSTNAAARFRRIAEPPPASAPVLTEVKSGSGFVTRVGEDGSARVLMNFNDANSRGEPATRFVEAFVRDYQQANKLKESPDQADLSQSLKQNQRRNYEK